MKQNDSIYAEFGNQGSLFNEKAPHFSGSDYIPKLDHKRLTTQLDRILDLMKDSVWRTLGEIEAHTGYPQASVSAQLRNARKQKHGGYIVHKQRRKLAGLFEYRVV